MNPRFSVLVPVYNRPQLVRETIDSVLAQSFTDYELILIDDGSTDETPTVLESYGDRIKVLHQANQGPEAARHFAAKSALGEYFVLLDSDDLLYPHALAIYDRVIREFDAPPVVIGAMRVYQTGGPVPSSRSISTGIEIKKFANFYSRDVIFGTTCSELVIKKTAVQETGAFPPVATAFPVDTADMLLALGSSGPWIVIREPATIAYRIHSANTIGNVDFMIQGIHRLLELDQSGRYRGGSVGHRARRAYIGGVAWYWFRRALRARRYTLAANHFRKCFLAIATGSVLKLRRRFRATTAPQSVSM